MNLAAHFTHTEMPLGHWLRDAFPRLQREPGPSHGQPLPRSGKSCDERPAIVPRLMMHDDSLLFSGTVGAPIVAS